MRKQLSYSGTAWTARLALSLAVLSGGLNAAAQSVYSSPSGSGTACSQGAPCSITQAQINARSLAPAGTGNVNVILGSGTYALSSPLIFSAQDSGQNGHKVVWQAASGAQPVISGGNAIAGWAPDSTYSNLWSATVSSTLESRQLYANGVRLPRASGTLGAGPLAAVSLTWTSTGYTSSSSTMSSWKNPSNIEFVYAGGHGQWTEPRCDVAGISGTTITMRQPCWNNQQLLSTPTEPDGNNPSGGFYPLGAAKPTRVENAFELLTPGHWYLDQTARKIYYDPQPGDSIASISFVAPVLEQLIVSTGSPAAPVHDITFQGLQFSYTTWLQPSGNDGFSEMQANMSITGPGGAASQGLCGYVTPMGSCPFGAWTRPPAAVDLTGTQNVSFLGNKFEHLGGAGLGLLHGANTDSIQGNELTDISSNGIELGGVDDPQPATFAATDIAMDKNATQSSTGYGGLVSRAVDGNTDGSFYDNSVSHTNDDLNAWWQVDLGSVLPLKNISIYNRTDCCADRLSDYWVFVSAKPFNTALTPTSQASQPGVWSSHQTTQAGLPTSIAVPASGRYVMVQLSGTNYLALAEVQVFATTAGLTQNTISDNWIHGTGIEFTGAVGLFAGYTSNTTIAHNQINDMPYSGISFGWGGWHTNAATPNANPNSNANNVIADNLIYNTMGIRGDGGAVYTNGAQGTSLTQGLTISGNVAFANPLTNMAYYTDGGSSNVTINGNVHYGDNGYFNGGCSTPGPIEVENNYYLGSINLYACANTGSPSEFIVGGGNVPVPFDPLPNAIPSNVLSAAGLEAAYTELTTTHVPVVAIVSQISSGEILISGEGFTPASEVTVGGAATPSVTYMSSNYLLAVIPSGVSQGQVTVTTAAGTSAATATSLTSSPDIAIGHTATQSSTYGTYTASLAVDGNTNTNAAYGSVSHTNDDTNAWWQVDLGSQHSMSAISVWNRTDCCASRDTDYWVFVSPNPFNTALTPVQQAAQSGVWSSHQTGQVGTPTTIASMTSGRYVMVQLSGTNYLALAEVQVMP